MILWTFEFDIFNKLSQKIINLLADICRNVNCKNYIEYDTLTKKTLRFAFEVFFGCVILDECLEYSNSITPPNKNQIYYFLRGTTMSNRDMYNDLLLSRPKAYMLLSFIHLNYSSTANHSFFFKIDQLRSISSKPLLTKEQVRDYLKVLESCGYIKIEKAQFRCFGKVITLLRDPPYA